MHHAWLCTRDGVVVDPTWRDAEHCVYFGVPFTQNFLAECVVATGVAGLFYTGPTHKLALNPTADWSAIIEPILTSCAMVRTREEHGRHDARA